MSHICEKRCPKCGYTEDDSLVNGNHGVCSGYPVFDWEYPVREKKVRISNCDNCGLLTRGDFGTCQCEKCEDCGGMVNSLILSTCNDCRLYLCPRCSKLHLGGRLKNNTRGDHDDVKR